MTTPNYTQKMDELRKRVETHSKFLFAEKTNNSFSIKMPNINISSPIFYILPPVIILAILFFMKPSFITVDTINKDNEIKKTIVYSKLLIAVLVGGFIIDIGIWGFLRKKI